MSDTINTFIVKCYEDQKIVKIIAPEGTTILTVLEKIKDYLGSTGNYYHLFYRGKKLSKNKVIDFYDIEDHGLLVFTKENNPNSEFFRSLKNDSQNVDTAQTWLSENIGVDMNEIQLISYERREEDVNIIYKDDPIKYKLTLYGGSVKEYDISKD